MNELLTAIAKNNKQEIIRLLDTGFDPNVKDADGRTALMQTVIDGKNELTELLIERRVNLDVQDSRGFSALHFAAQDYRIEAAKALLQSGASVDICDEFGNTPLWRAVFNSRERGEIIKLLLDYGADRQKKNKSDVSPIDLARTISNYDVKQFFD